MPLSVSGTSGPEKNATPEEASVVCTDVSNEGMLWQGIIFSEKRINEKVSMVQNSPLVPPSQNPNFPPRSGRLFPDALRFPPLSVEKTTLDDSRAHYVGEEHEMNKQWVCIQNNQNN